MSIVKRNMGGKVLFGIGKIVPAVAASLVVATAAMAEYPEKPVNLIVPYGAGGAADLAARIIANEAPEYLGDNVLVANQTGAAGVTGSTVVAKGKKDGYTLLMSRVGSQATVPAMNETIPYTWDEFTMLGLVEMNPFAVAVAADSPYETFDDLAAAIKGGERLKYSSAGVGTLLHMASLIMIDDLGVDTDAHIHVPFKGGGAATTAVVGGDADFIFHNLSGLIGGIEGGQLRALLVTTPERVGKLPDTPTASEVGHPKLEAVIGWSGVWGPGGMDQPATDKWVGVLDSLKSDDSWIEATETLGSIPMVMSPEDTRAFVEAQFNTFRDVADKLGMVVR